MTATVHHELPIIVTEAEVTQIERLCPSFVRVELASPELADFGVDGGLFDQRIKIVFPNAYGRLPQIQRDSSWYSSWRSQPADERGHMRTYTIRDVRGSGIDTRIVVDFVIHEHDGHTGPGSGWATTAQPGDRVVITAPRRGQNSGGIEFNPEDASQLLFVADETAVPALCGILRDLDDDAHGVAFVEVPTISDVLPLFGPAGIQVVWLPREGAPIGLKQIDAVRKHFGLVSDIALVDDHLVDPNIWETPFYSSAGEPITDVDDFDSAETPLAEIYAWIAGESKMVTTLRRALVNDLGLSRKQVAFMGYWRQGIAMAH